jgi:hypothetical protein
MTSEETEIGLKNYQELKQAQAKKALLVANNEYRIEAELPKEMNLEYKSTAQKLDASLRALAGGSKDKSEVLNEILKFEHNLGRKKSELGNMANDPNVVAMFNNHQAMIDSYKDLASGKIDQERHEQEVKNIKTAQELYAVGNPHLAMAGLLSDVAGPDSSAMYLANNVGVDGFATWQKELQGASVDQTSRDTTIQELYGERYAPREEKKESEPAPQKPIHPKTVDKEVGKTVKKNVEKVLGDKDAKESSLQEATLYVDDRLEGAIDSLHRLSLTDYNEFLEQIPLGETAKVLPSEFSVKYDTIFKRGVNDRVIPRLNEVLSGDVQHLGKLTVTGRGVNIEPKGSLSMMHSSERSAINRANQQLQREIMPFVNKMSLYYEQSTNEIIQNLLGESSTSMTIEGTETKEADSKGTTGPGFMERFANVADRFQQDIFGDSSSRERLSARGVSSPEGQGTVLSPSQNATESVTEAPEAPSFAKNIATLESGGLEQPFIRTQLTGSGSSAYGPLPITKGILDGELKNNRDSYSPEEQDAMEELSERQRVSLLIGGGDRKKYEEGGSQDARGQMFQELYGYETRKDFLDAFDYGGDLGLADDEDFAWSYTTFSDKMLQATLKRHKGDELAAAAEWHGGSNWKKAETKSRTEAYLKKYKALLDE